MILERFKMMIRGLDQSKLKAGADREPKNSNREVLWIIAGFLICCICTANVYAATLAVTSTDDTVAADGHCTLREAITAVNNGASLNECVPVAGSFGSGDLIGFDINAAADAGCNSATGVCVIQLASSLPAITKTVTIDGYTQPWAAPNTNAGTLYSDAEAINAVIKIEIDGGSAAAGASALIINSANSVVQGLAIVNFSGSGMTSNNSGALIAGNFIGVHADGVTAGGNNYGLSVYRNTQVGSASVASRRNLVSGNAINVYSNFLSQGNTIAGNLIGTDRTGAQPLGSPGIGILVRGTNEEISNNVMAGCNIGLSLSGAQYIAAHGNGIGIGVGGADLGNSMFGALIQDDLSRATAANNIYGNGVANNTSGGISVQSNNYGDADGNRLDTNAIWNNGGLGIDLKPSNNSTGVVTPNDDLDADTGANGLQNFPVISSAMLNASGGVNIVFTLDSAANGSYAISAYASDNCDPSGYGQGQYPAPGTPTVYTDGSGHVAATLTVPAPLPPGWAAGQYVALLATDNVGNNTSEFSGCVLITSSFAAPTVTTGAVMNIASTTADSGGNVTSDGGTAVSGRGVCWSAVSNPTTADTCTSDGSGIGSFASSITGLTPAATYHVRAYATNFVGTSYGSDVQFSTVAAAAPTVTTAPVINISFTTAGSGGEVTSDGGAPVTDRGVCWRTTPDPMTADNCTHDGTGAGSFASSLTGLTPGTIYHVRAYATNGRGTGYGDDVQFTTVEVAFPTVTTAEVTNITSATAGSGGKVTSQGGAAVSDRGVCYGADPDPTTADSCTHDGSGTGEFMSSLTGLTAGQTYHARAYATNLGGTAYGSDHSFFTLCVTAVAKFGQTNYGSLQAAATAATGGGTISANTITFLSTVFSNSSPVQLHGGYDCYFNQVVSFSTISGSITLSGAAEVEMTNIVIK